MKSKRLLRAIGCATFGGFIALQGCGDENDPSGSGGTSGAAGSAGKGGTSGASGASGAAGSAGKGGSSGQGGASGASGGAGKGGTSGKGGTAGTTTGGGEAGQPGGAGDGPGGAGSGAGGAGNGPGGADGEGGESAQCANVQRDFPCPTDGTLCENLGCGLALSGKRDCACATNWTCTSCNFADSWIRDRPSPIELCPAGIADEVACDTTLDHVVCGPQVNGEYCACWSSPSDGQSWDCDDPPSSWN